LIAQLTRGRGPIGFLETRYHVVERLRSATAGGTTIVRDATSALGAVRGVATSLLGVVVIAFLTLFMLLEGPEWRRRVLALTPEPGRPALERVGAGVYRCVAGFVSGNLVASLLAGCVATVIVLVAGVPYALPLGLFVAIVDLVPFAGPIVATVVVSAVALADSAGTALVVLLLLTGYHVVEGHTVRPLLYGRGVALSPLTVLVALLLCTEVFGLLGTLLAIPIAGTVSVVLAELLGPRAEPGFPTDPYADPTRSQRART
jgi:predicted PurR-regulated permease PerM